MKSVRNDESTSPKMMTEPSARHVASERVIGMMPKMVRIDAMKIASRRDYPASTIFSPKGDAAPLVEFDLVDEDDRVFYHDTEECEDADESREREWDLTSPEGRGTDSGRRNRISSIFEA